MKSAQHTVVVVGGGSAGISVAARLRNADPELDVAVIEPSDTHYYQPLWTLVGGGVFDRSVTARPMASVMPPGVRWIRDRAVGFDPEGKRVETAAHGAVHYEQLVLCPGIQLNWDEIEGLAETLGRNGVCSNYSFDTVDYTWACIRGFRGGRALFTAPGGTIKCGGAPQKIMWIAEHRMRMQGVRAASELVYAISGARIFGVEKYRRTLEALVVERGIETRFEHELVRVDGERKVATFRHEEGEVELAWELMHVTPPQSAPEVIRRSALADDEGWIAADRHRLQHPRFPEVFALGDAAGLPCARTGAAVRKQAPVVVQNLLAQRRGDPLDASYDGYSSCPIITEIGKVMLAEFDYEGRPCETFPFDQARPRYTMYALKAYGLPEMYWNGMLRGHL